MKREELILKWLNHDLSDQELEAFKTLDDYDELIKLSNSLKQFKAPEFKTSEELDILLQKTRHQKRKTTNLLKPILRIAAVIAICFSAYYYTTIQDTSIKTLASEKTNIELPDNSKAIINALSSLTYNEKSWQESRNLKLEGEAYFIVESGSKFSVNTDYGKVTVLGTEFNVKQRKNLFEVICYEGSVKVEHKSKSKILKPGDNFLILNGKYIATEKESTKNPTWINNESYFKSLPFKFVLQEFKRQYNLTIDSNKIDDSVLFTGGFTHNNLQQALQAITIPLNLTYNIESNHIVFKQRD